MAALKAALVLALAPAIVAFVHQGTSPKSTTITYSAPVDETVGSQCQLITLLTPLL